MMLKERLTILKVLNNSALIVKGKHKEYILLGSGIAFGKSQGMYIETNAKVDKMYAFMENAEALEKIMDANKDEASFIADAISVLFDTLSMKIKENLLISFCDHVAIMYSRVLKNEIILNPFLEETKALYADSFQIAERLCAILYANNNIKLPEDEVAYLALHIQNIRNKHEDISVLLLNKVIVDIKELLTETYQVVLQGKEDEYARFISHIKFLMSRIIKDMKLKNDMKDIIQIRYVPYYPLAKKVAWIIEKELSCKITEEELAFIVIHLIRFIEL